MPTTATISTFGVQPGWIQYSIVRSGIVRINEIIELTTITKISINQLFTLKSLTAKGMKKIVSMTYTVDKNKKSLRINYLCPTGAIPVFYDFSTTKKKTR